MIRRLALLASIMPALVPTDAVRGAVPATPQAVLAAAPRRDWAAIDPENLLLIQLADGGRVVIALAPAFAPLHIANIRLLARTHWFDGTAIVRVQDDYVTQWGDPDGKRPLPPGVSRALPAEYERSHAGLSITPVRYRDTYAPRVGLLDGFPVANDGKRAWLTHCYGMVGVARDNNPDTGTGAELYAVIGHAPRALDRNIALVGRVVEGMDRLAALPRGSGDLGFYADARQRPGIVRVGIAADLPAAERPGFEWLRPASASFAAWLRVKANRHDAFYLRPAGAVDLCNVLPPVRRADAG